MTLNSESPLVTVIIPTAGRRIDELKRAVRTSTEGFSSGAVEVVVVPNGDPARWRDSVRSIADMPSLRIISIADANVSAARNKGLQEARGALVRFLDDDDFLIPSVAAEQCLELARSEADMSTYQARIEDNAGRNFGVSRRSGTNDVTQELLAARCVALPLVHVFRRSFISSLKWNEKRCNAEDVEWLHCVVRQRDVRWIQSDKVVGVWYQHPSPRLSSANIAQEPTRVYAESILETFATLDRQARLTEKHAAATAEGLWFLLHRAFYLSPLYWHRAATRIRAISPASRPPIGLYKHPALVFINPLVIEWVMIPKRIINHFVRILRNRLDNTSHIRRF